MHRVARLRKTFGPLSAGTAVYVHGEVGSHGYVRVSLVNISRKFREQIEHHPVYHQLMKPWDIEFDMIVFKRGQGSS